MPDGWQPPSDGNTDENDDEGEEKPTPLDWTVELRNRNGNTAVLPLSHDDVLYPQVQSIPRHASFLESDEPAEVLYRRYAFPLADFVKDDPAFDANQLAGVRFDFGKSTRGAVIIDDIAIAPARSTAWSR